MSFDYYETLELNRNATTADIKKAYRRLALKFHPSSNTEAGSSEKFTQLSEAYDVLSDPCKKATYDKFGEEGLKGGIPTEYAAGGAWSSKYTYHGQPEKTFRQFFGGNNPFSDFHTTDAPLRLGGLKQVVLKTQDPPVEKDLQLTLEELYHGCTKRIEISRRELADDSEISSIKKKVLCIDVKPGWKEGTRIIFNKEGDQGPNNIPADIVFIVVQKIHPRFVREDNDLIYTARISLEMALTGFSVDVKTLDGRILTIPINDIVHPSYKKVVFGEGMPLFQDSVQKGNLIITFDIQFPEKLSPEQRYLTKKALKS
ncbi:dnaJ homolog subfamily B member 13-like [Cynoglossus semilaevis]|uniref:DnaJ homolog subfamily B member 13 n=1 Tax=Cynoglossus semilaevis TaxID=244447 RepID=A0A3P8W9L2_CYNSE|nr:dnaJ homolog subfamily B member 13-like [Cynoglossus semilaevis]